MRVYVEPINPRPTLWILGHGRLAECLCRLGALMAFDVVVDDSMASADEFPDASRIIADDHNYEALAPEAQDFVIIATQHKGEHQSLCRVLASDVGYIALIASLRRTGLVIEYLREAGFDRGAIDRVRAPAGLEIGARTAEEIALSVISEMVLIRRGRSSHQASRRSTEQAAPAREARQPASLSAIGQRRLRAAGQ